MEKSGTPEPIKTLPSISVILPTLIKTDKHLGMTLRCIELARKHTDIPFELVIVETGTKYLSDYADLYLHEPEKTTDTKSLNNGFYNASGDYICLLTNDVFVDEKWLDCLLDCFKMPDCGIATLATDQFNHVKKDEISEGIWFSLAMFPRQDKYFDEAYVNSWNDSDFIMRQYLKGLKSYRNYNCVVKHLIGATQYADKKHYDNYRCNMQIFKGRYKDTGHRIYDVLTMGIVL